MSLVALIKEVQMLRQCWGVQVTHSTPHIRKYVSMQRSYLQFTPLTPLTHTHTGAIVHCWVLAVILCVCSIRKGAKLYCLLPLCTAEPFPKLQKKIACTSYGSPYDEHLTGILESLVTFCNEPWKLHNFISLRKVRELLLFRKLKWIVCWNM